MTASEYAKQNGFAGAKPLAKWNGYRCYEAVYESGTEDIPHIGFPQIILEKDNRFRMADYDEALAIIEKLE